MSRVESWAIALTILILLSHRTEKSKMRDPFGELGLSQNASLAEVKKAFRRLALEHHPDR